jgi:nuclear pore complex protein Nup160
MSVQAESKNHTAKASSTVLENVAQPQQHNILEQLFAHDIAPIPYTSPGDGSSLTKNICKLLRWATGGDYEDLEIDNILVHIQCSLIKNNNLAVATTFLKYQPSTAWSTYIRGRLSLLLHDYEEAAIHFRKAAFRLCKFTPP